MRVVSGIKPTGKMHIGNYLGAVRGFIDHQNRAEESYIFVANYHALNTHPEPDRLRENTRDILLDYMALGLDPMRTTLFLQSSVREVAELTLILSNYVPMGLLERAHAYKDAVAKQKNINHGLFSYPVLMAADILLYAADVVPVGRDQKQHVEITRDIALKFNNIFGDILIVPEPVIDADVAVIPGTDGRKMSKSYDNTIEIFVPLKTVKKQIMSIVTDSASVDDILDPDKCNVFALYKYFADASEIAEMREKYRSKGYGYGHAKLELFAKVEEYFAPFRRKREELAADKEYVDEILKEGARRASEKASETLASVRKAVGIIDV